MVTRRSRYPGQLMSRPAEVNRVTEHAQAVLLSLVLAALVVLVALELEILITAEVAVLVDIQELVVMAVLQTMAQILL